MRLLRQPYSWFLNRHSADLGKNILSEVGQVISFGLKPLMEIIAKVILVIMLIILLILIDPKLALIVGCTLLVAYYFIFNFFHKYLNRIGEERVKNNEKRFKVVTEAFGASKEVKLGGLEKFMLSYFQTLQKYLL